MENKETKANEPINIIYNSANVISTTGLTKREYFASMALQGIIATKMDLILKLNALLKVRSIRQTP
jgi:hypothetical protein